MNRLYKLLTVLFLIFCTATLHGELPQIHHNPWELIIFRPTNSPSMDTVRCWLKITDMDGKDVTDTAVRATYWWAAGPDVEHKYKYSPFLSGGMYMHLYIDPGRYTFTFSTPSDQQYPYPSTNREEWKSNNFVYDTKNPAKVIFVYPTANDNGFYNGGWEISGKAPKYWKFTKPKMQKK